MQQFTQWKSKIFHCCGWHYFSSHDRHVWSWVQDHTPAKPTISYPGMIWNGGFQHSLPTIECNKFAVPIKNLVRCEGRIDDANSVEQSQLGCVSSTTAGAWYFALHWRHNDHDGVSNHQPQGCLLNRLFRRRSKKTSKIRVTGLCVGNSPGPVNSPHKGPVTRKCFHLMTSPCALSTQTDD